jgi:hypothetical protein
MEKRELFNNRYGEVLAAIKASPGISNAELAQSFGFSYNITRLLTAAMEKEGDITGRVERSGLHSKTLWQVNPHKECSPGRTSIFTKTATAPEAARRVPFPEVEEYFLPVKQSAKHSEAR